MCNSSPISSVNDKNQKDQESEPNREGSDNQAELSHSIGSNTTLHIENQYARNSSNFDHLQQAPPQERTAISDSDVEETSPPVNSTPSIVDLDQISSPETIEDTAKELKAKLDNQLVQRRKQIEAELAERERVAQGIHREEEKIREDTAHKFITAKIKEDKRKADITRQFNEDTLALEAQLVMPNPTVVPTSPLTASVGPKDVTTIPVPINQREESALGKDSRKRMIPNKNRNESPGRDDADDAQLHQRKDSSGQTS